MKSSPTSIHQAFIDDICVRIYEESLPRMRTCLGMISQEQLWYRPNNSCNSIGNQILHLIGNVTQYIMHGVGQQPDIRQRNDEFIADQNISIAELLIQIDHLETITKPTIQKIDVDDLLSIRRVQVFDLSVISILIHVAEHLSYHVGQITYITKMLTDTETYYYGGLKLD